MSTLRELKDIINVLEANGVDLDQPIAAGHDVICISNDEDVPYAAELEEAGAIWSNENDSWVLFT